MTDTVEVVEVKPSGRTRRRYSAEFKHHLVEQALRPDVSLAAVALAQRHQHELARALAPRVPRRFRRGYSVERTDICTGGG
jgi:transposase-like protein